MNKYNLIAYGQSFVSFLLPRIKEFPVEEIIVFGSAARGEADKESDVDIFMDIKDEKKATELEKTVNRELKKFYRSKFYEVWKRKGVENEIRVKVGNLDEWELRRSVISDGVVLYGGYKSMPSDAEHWVLVSLEPIKNITKRNRVMRELRGRKEKDYSSKGLVEKIDGDFLNPRVFVVPSSQTDKILDVLKKEKVGYRLFEFWSDQL